MSVELTWTGKAEGDHRPEPDPLTTIELAPGADGSGAPRGRLIHGENGGVLAELTKTLAGAVDLIVIDPPFATGTDRLYETTAGRRKLRARAYADQWSRDLPGYLDMMRARLRLCHELLSPRGSLYLHCDPRTSHALRFLGDELFGPRRFINELVWFYKTGGLPEKLGFGRKHDTILFYVKDPEQAIWNPQKEKSYLSHRYGFSNVQIHEDAGGPYTEVNCRDVFDIPALRGNQPERVDYPTQKPEALLERIIRASSVPDSLVVDVFSGSGTTAVTAAKLGRRFLACDRGAWAIHMARSRLLALGADDGPAPGFTVEQAGTRDEPAPEPELARLRPRLSKDGAELILVGPRSRSRALDGIHGWLLEAPARPDSEPLLVTASAFRTRRRAELAPAVPLTAPAGTARLRLFDTRGASRTLRLEA